ncbi:hypothetical protein KI387_012935, partial [Taxus chinensis]
SCGEIMSERKICGPQTDGCTPPGSPHHSLLPAACTPLTLQACESVTLEDQVMFFLATPPGRLPRLVPHPVRFCLIWPGAAALLM